MPSRRAWLNEQLETFAPVDATEAAYHRRMLELLAGDGDPMSRDHFEPGHFTASAFILAPDNDDMLLILHSKLHRWLQPGGHVDPEDEDLIAAALREVREEVDIHELTLAHEGVFDVDIHPIPAMRGDPAHEHFDVRFLFRADSRAFNAGSDAHDARWVPLEEINPSESDESVMRAVRKLRST